MEATDSDSLTPKTGSSSTGMEVNYSAIDPKQAAVQEAGPSDTMFPDHHRHLVSNSGGEPGGGVD